MKSITHELRRELMLNKELLETSTGSQGVSAGSRRIGPNRIGGILELRVTVVAPDGRVIGDSYVEVRSAHIS